MQQWSSSNRDTKIAILIPCLNEEKTIEKVVLDFNRELPNAKIFVFDNLSTDHTAQIAKDAGAQVVIETRRGKGAVVQSMFQKIEADVYVIVDGDDTYPAQQVHQLLEPILNGCADMTIGSRIMKESNSEFKFLNWIGNKWFQGIINIAFGTRLTDILSGYRAMNRKLVKSLPLFQNGFEIEAELTIKALERRFSLKEIPVDLRSRPQGSFSKIKILHDGIKILGTIFSLFRDYKPLTFFGFLGLCSFLAGSIFGIDILLALKTGTQSPSLFAGLLAYGFIFTGGLLVAVGLILHTINRRFREMEYFQRLLVETPKD